jgi:hypothetical protein
MSGAETNSAFSAAAHKQKQPRRCASPLTYKELHKAFLMRCDGHSFSYIGAYLGVNPGKLSRAMAANGNPTKGWCIRGHSPKPPR